VETVPAQRETAGWGYDVRWTDAARIQRSPRPPPDRKGGVVNKSGLIAEVSKRTGLSKADVGRVLEAAMSTIRETVVRGDRVSLVGFGTFERTRRNQRLARNPRKPEIEIIVPARDLPAFHPGKDFREAVLARRLSRRRR
jgi:DNA-binding protein HU-beta